MELTPKQKKFADNYVKTGNATESYITVYKCKTSTAEVNGCKALSNAKVVQYIAERNKKLEKSTIADMTEVKEFWTKIFRDGIQTVKVDGEDKEYPVDVKDRLKASEYIAKTNAAFVDKVEVKGEITAVTISLEQKMKLIESIKNDG